MQSDRAVRFSYISHYIGSDLRSRTGTPGG